jgi:hypothetical protein
MQEDARLGCKAASGRVLPLSSGFLPENQIGR